MLERYGRVDALFDFYIKLINSRHHLSDSSRMQYATGSAERMTWAQPNRLNQKLYGLGNLYNLSENHCINFNIFLTKYKLSISLSLCIIYIYVCVCLYYMYIKCMCICVQQYVYVQMYMHGSQLFSYDITHIECMLLVSNV